MFRLANTNGPVARVFKTVHVYCDRLSLIVSHVFVNARIACRYFQLLSKRFVCFVVFNLIALRYCVRSYSSLQIQCAHDNLCASILQGRYNFSLHIVSISFFRYRLIEILLLTGLGEREKSSFRVKCWMRH